MSFPYLIVEFSGVMEQLFESQVKGVAPNYVHDLLLTLVFDYAYFRWLFKLLNDALIGFCESGN